jgi:hypothetical protein
LEVGLASTTAPPAHVVRAAGAVVDDVIMRGKRRRHVYRRAGGWQVAVRRKGKLLRRQFGDAEHGGREEALGRALAWRDALLRRLAPATLIRKRYVPNTTGVIGVQLARDRTPAGGTSFRYRAAWYEIDGRLRMVSFSLDKYGEKRAKALAAKVRREAVARVLRERRRQRRA